MPHDAPPELGDLLAPIDADTFFAQFWERAPLHLEATEARRARPWLTHEALFDALFAQRTPPPGLMVFPEHMGRGALTDRDLLGDRGLFDAYIAEGHPLVWSRARGVFPAVDAACATLASAFGAHVWPNVYATGTAGRPFEMHFDCHEVFAVQCEGRKAWTISEVRVDRPLDAGAMEEAVRATMAARRDEAEARPALRFTASKGAVVYIPRGQFHNAETAGDAGARSLHVTFGVRLLSGHDVAELIARLALADPDLREYLPPTAADPDGARGAAQIDLILERIAALIAGRPLARAIAEARAFTIDRSRSA